MSGYTIWWQQNKLIKFINFDIVQKAAPEKGCFFIFNSANI